MLMTRYIYALKGLLSYTASPPYLTALKVIVCVGTFVLPFRLTLMCQIGGSSRLPLGLKLVHWLFTEKIASYDLPSWWWQHVGIVSLKPQRVPGERITIKSDKRGFYACLPARRRHLYAYKQASRTR